MATENLGAATGDGELSEGEQEAAVGGIDRNLAENSAPGNGVGRPLAESSAFCGGIFDAQGWRLWIAWFYEHSGHASAAENVYRKVLARRPTHPDALAGLGRLLLHARRFDEAVTIWTKASETGPPASSAVFQLARSLHRSGRLEKAAEQYLRALSLDPHHDKAIDGLAELSRRFVRIARNTADTSAAVRIGKQLQSFWRPQSLAAHRAVERIAEMIVIGASALAAHNPDAALEQFDVALSLAPDFPGALRGVADCHERLGHHEAALAYWRRLGGRDPEALEPRLHQQRLSTLLRPMPYRELTRGNSERTAALARAQGLVAAPGEGALDTIEPLLGQARSAYSAGRLDEAEALFRRILGLDPRNRGGLALLARVYMRQKRWVDAASVAHRMCELQPTAPEPRATLARALLEDGQLENAAAAYEDVVRLQPDNVEALEPLGRLYARLENWQGACRMLGRLVEEDPARIPSRLAYARALQQAGNAAEAAVQLHAILAANPREADALTLLGRLWMKTDPERAFECWARLAEVRPDAVEPPLQMARLRSRQQRFDEARQFYAAVITRASDHVEALSGLGRALAATDRTEAMRHFVRWAEQQPEATAPRLEIARLHLQARDFDRAEEIYREILERDTHDREAAVRLADLLSRDPARLDHALDLWRRIGARDPAAAHPFLQRAYLFERAGRSDEAEAEYRAALARAPDNEPALIGLARLLSSRPQPAEAAELFEAVHRQNPARTDALLGLGRVLERLGRDEEALAAYDKVQAIDPANVNALLYRGRLLRQLGRIEQAIEQWRGVCAAAPRNANAWHELVFMLATAEREAEALQTLDAAEAALEPTAQSWARLALAATAAQFHDRAVTYFERAIAAEPDEAGHRAQLGLYYLRQGILDGAFHHLLDSRELKPTDLPVAKRLVDTVHLLNDLGIDHVGLRQQAPRSVGEILVPERLFALIRRLADTEVAPYNPVTRRVVVVSASLAPGGAERQVVNTLRGLSAPGFTLDLLLFCISLSRRGRRDFFRPMLEDTGVEIVVPDERHAEDCLATPEAAPYARLIRHFPEDMVGPIAYWLVEFRRRRPQVVHAWQDSTNLTAAVAALLAGVPRIVLCARSVRPDNPRRRLKRFMREAYRAVLGHPSVVLSNNSRAGADDYASWLGLDSATVEVVYNGIDFDKLAASVDQRAVQEIRDSLAIPPDAPVLGSAFRMSEEKRPSLWVEVAGAVARQNPRAHFIVCGDGPERRNMAELAARLGIGERLHLPGPQSNIASWYKAMDAVMLTSRHEGLPNVLLEAQSLGLPVVAPDVGGMAETVWQGVTGWTIKKADAESLAERVLYSLGDTQWRQQAQTAAPPFVRERFGMAAMLRRTLEIYGISEATDAPA